MRITYNGTQAVRLPDIHRVVEPGETIAVPAELGKQLVEREAWRPAEKTTDAEKDVTHGI